MPPRSLTVSVVIATYTFDRWESLARTIGAAQRQTYPPVEVIVSVDHNPDLTVAARRAWADGDVTVIDSRYPGDVGSAKNSGLEVASGDIVLFIDDDVTPPADLIAKLVRIYDEDATAQGIGVAATPDFDTARPRFLAPEFDWIVGCTYRGLPSTRGPMGRMVGSCMSARREALLAVRGFHADHHSDLDISHRLIARYGWDCLVFDPDLVVSHQVPASRVTFRYLAHRVFSTNRGKVRVIEDLGEGGNNASDRAFVSRFLLRYLPRHLASVRSGGWQAALGGISFIALAAAGNAAGRIDSWLGRSQPELTQGLDPERSTPEPSETGSRHA